MSEKEDDFTRVFIMVLAFLVLFTIVVILVARGVGQDQNSGPMTEQDIDERTKPYSTVRVAGQTVDTPKPAPAPAPAPAAAMPEPAPAAPAAPMAAAPAAAPAAAAVAAIDGQSLYSACAACHDTGAAGAPRLGDVNAWSTRIPNGIDALTTAAINGKGAMPAKGGRVDLSDAQIRAIVEYMVAESK